MKKGKRLLIMLLTTLAMLVGTVSISYAAASDYYISGLNSNTDGTVTVLSVNSNYRTVGTVYRQHW